MFNTGIFSVTADVFFDWSFDMNALSPVNVMQQTTASNLGLRPGLRLSKEVMDLAGDLSRVDLSFVIKRLVIKDEVPEELAQRMRLEFLRFVCLRKAHTGILVPSELVDNFWHAFILYTEEYTDFCERHLGGYMHHRPQDHSRSKFFEENIAARRTFGYLNQMFPSFDKQIWANSAICSNDGDCGCP